MKRLLMEKLFAWSESPSRKPLILEGARQVGKTWILKEFGRAKYDSIAYVSLDNARELWRIFERPFNLKKILLNLGQHSGVEIVPGKTLIVLDEIQSCPDAITLLKYWQEEAPEYHVATAGSLLGLCHLTGSGFPVGKTNFLSLHPMNFQEFLMGMGEDRLWDLIESGDLELASSFQEKFKDLLRSYLVVGGMPDAVKSFLRSLSYDEARERQKEMLKSFSNDIVKHVPANALEQVRAVWHSLPQQLAKPDKRFVAAQARPESSSRNTSRDLRNAFEWLEEAGMARRVWNVTKPGLPLASYRNHIFKLFSLDVGLLSAQSGLTRTAMAGGDGAFCEFKGALTEQFVNQELLAAGYETFTWMPPDSKAEIDFLVQTEDGLVVPMEVKANKNLKAKSLKIYRAKFDPAIALRASLGKPGLSCGLLDLPLYAISKFSQFLPKD